MKTQDKNKKKLYKTLSKLIKQNKKNQIDEQVTYVKSFLYYVGIVLLSTIYVKNNSITNEEYNDIISNGNLEKLSLSFHDLHLKYFVENSLSTEERIAISKELFDLDKSDLDQISLGELYQIFITSKEKKYLGQVYTPKHIVTEMIRDGIKKEKMIANPYFKVIDPACGGGYFLMEAYDKIREIIKEHYDEIVITNPQLEQELEQDLHSFIITNNLWGTDIDEFAVFMTTISLYIKGKGCGNPSPNVFKKDILLEGRETLYSLLDNEITASNSLLNQKFDLVIGNPPYIGHKKVDNQYRKNLKNHYSDVYSDKADISFCFFKKGYELLKQGGTLLFITSRYFLESPSARGLRSFLTSKSVIEKIIDFQGKNVFKGIGISPVIIKCKKGELSKNETHIYKLNAGDTIDNTSNSLMMGEVFNHFVINQSTFLPEGWILMDEDERSIYEKIHSMGDYYLNQVSNSHQGIITGCDSAFIVDEKTILQKGLERSLIKPWIKNSNIRKFRVSENRLYIIYTDLIEDLKLYPNTRNYIAPYKEKLKKRRECQKGIRQWYQLQWGRNADVFSNPKIVFPYKSETNRFTIVYEEIMCSADVYIINIKESTSLISLEYLVAFLNSSLFEFYFKSVGKKVGEYQYDYYPNKIMNLRIKIGDNTKEITGKVKELLELYKEIEIKENEDKYNSTITEKDIGLKIKDINKYFYDLYELSDNQVGIIERSIKNSVS